METKKRSPEHCEEKDTILQAGNQSQASQMWKLAAWAAECRC